MEICYYTYILANQRNGMLYVGVTCDLLERVREHKYNQEDEFVAKYAIHSLVYFERHPDENRALRREKRLKQWPRKWKAALIEIENSEWRDLYPLISGSRRFGGTH